MRTLSASSPTTRTSSEDAAEGAPVKAETVVLEHTTETTTTHSSRRHGGKSIGIPRRRRRVGGGGVVIEHREVEGADSAEIIMNEGSEDGEWK